MRRLRRHLFTLYSAVSMLLCVAVWQRQVRTALAAWIAFGALLFAASFLDVEPVHRLYVLTFPWLVHHRPPHLTGFCILTDWLNPVLDVLGFWRLLGLNEGD